MNIAILHYHLNRGGVTRVIANHLLALDRTLSPSDSCRVALLFGGRADGWPADLENRLKSIALSLHPVPRLEYDSRPVAEADALADELLSALRRVQFAPERTLLHVHNHALGKNASLPGALARLAAEGFGLLLQIHDFAEDFRPNNYRLLTQSFGAGELAATLYPQAPRIHYAVLNRRDESVLKGAGLSAARLHLLPNPVPEPARLPDRAAARRRLAARFGVEPRAHFIMYPVRAIRRKNLGEALLWSALLGDRCRVGQTLAPLNPAEQGRYRRWKEVARELALPFLFETGEKEGLAYEENLAAADLILTTSIAEGFGMVFLETWLTGRMLAGRNLPEITADFAEAGLRFDRLYDRLPVPVEFVGRDELLREFRESYTRVLASYGRPPLSPAECERAVEEKIRDSCVDFGDLNEPLQERVIRRAVGDPAARERLLSSNRNITHAPVSGGRLHRSTPATPSSRGAEQLSRSSKRSAEQVIETNRQIVQQAYSLQAIGARLSAVYRDVLAAPGGQPVFAPAFGGSILDRFLDPGRFRLLRGN